MRRDVQEIFRTTPHEKQVMMFSATLAKEIRPICKKFMQDVIMPLKLSHSCCLLENKPSTILVYGWPPASKRAIQFAVKSLP